jgi:hypothetical protein
MTLTLLAVSAAYVVLSLVVLSMGLTSRFAWWVKATTIVVSSGFFVEVFFASKGLLGWPASGALPPKFQLLWTRVVEPDVKAGNRGAIYLWVEEVDGNNVPSGLPRSYQLPYSVKLADRTLKARDEIMAGNPQEGLAEEITEGDPSSADASAKPNQQADGGITSTGGKVELEGPIDQVPRVEFRPMSNPLLPPKP